MDSYSIQALADLTSSRGTLAWLISPLSYLGLAPFSYSPAVPVSLAAFEELSGIHGESAGLIYSIVLGAVVPLASFALGFSTYRKTSMALLVAFLVSTAVGIVNLTTWTVATRGPFLALTPLAMAFFVDVTARRAGIRSRLLPLLLVLGTLVLIHAMFLLLLPALVAAFFLYRITVIQDRLLRHRSSAPKRDRVLLLTLVAVGIGLGVSIALGPASDTLSAFPALQSSLIPDSLLTRMGVQWLTLVGLGALFLPMGLYQLARAPDRGRTFALMSLAVAFLPLALNPTYGILIAIPVVLLVAALGMAPRERGTKSTKVARYRGSATITIIAALAIVVLPMAITVPRTSGVPCNEPGTLDPQTYNTGLYLRYAPTANFSFVWDDHIEAQRVEAISGTPSLEPVLSIGDLEYPWIAARMRVTFTSTVQLTDFLAAGHQVFDAREWLSTLGTSYPYYWGKHTYTLLQYSPDSPASQQIMNFYHASFAIARCGSGHTMFFDAMSSSNYVLYADELQRAYWIKAYT